MPRCLLAVCALLLAAGPASAVIKVLTPLKQVLDAEELMFAAEVAKVDPDRPAVVFAFQENLKGKCPFESLPVNLTGDSYAQKDGHSRVMLDRLAEGRKLVLFASKQGKGFSAFGFIEGTWFQMKGTPDADGKTVRWAFLHCEPYFRRTFKGTTAELKDVVTKYVAGKGEPPAPDEKEPAGYGPKVEEKKLPASGGRKPPVAHAKWPAGDTQQGAYAPRSPILFAVLPSFVLVGPLAVIAALFPATFARLALGMTRWRAFLVVASLTSTLALVYFWVRPYLPDSRWLGPQAFAAYLLAVAAIGLIWSGRRYRVLAAADPGVTAPPTRNELLTLLGLTVFAGTILAAIVWFTSWVGLVELPWREFTAIAAGLAAATGYAVYRAATTSRDRPLPQLSLSGESVGLAAMLLFGAATLVGMWPRGHAELMSAGQTGEATSGPGGPKLAEVKLFFESADAHQVLSGVTVAGDRLLFGTMKQSGFRAAGTVFCIDRSTGRPVWTFDDGGGLKPVFSTPAVDGNRVFVGEGLHTDADRRLFALDAATGRPLWSVPTTSHTEGSPRVAGDLVVFPAGDDGLFCVSAADGREVWHIRGTEQQLHVDTPPAVAGRRVFFGSGYNTLALFAANLGTGQELWRTSVNLRSFGPPLVRGNHVFFGLGTGNLVDDLSTEPEDGVPPETQPAGAIVCLDAKTGAVVWRYDLPKSVHVPLAADRRTIYACGKDGWVYALNRADGKLRWKRQVGSAFAAGPAVASYAHGAATLAVYAVSQDGRAVALDPADGSLNWMRDLSEAANRNVEVFSTPVVVTTEPNGARRHVYFGAMLTNRNNQSKAAAVFRIEDIVDE